MVASNEANPATPTKRLPQLLRTPEKASAAPTTHYAVSTLGEEEVSTAASSNHSSSCSTPRVNRSISNSPYSKAQALREFPNGTDADMEPGTLVTPDNVSLFVSTQVLVRTTDSYRNALVAAGSVDPAKECFGVIVKVRDDKEEETGFRVQVMWNNGRPLQGYRVGVQNKFDLESANVAVAQEVDWNPSPEKKAKEKKPKKGLWGRMMSPFKGKLGISLDRCDASESNPRNLAVSVGYLNVSSYRVMFPFVCAAVFCMWMSRNCAFLIFLLICILRVVQCHTGPEKLQYNGAAGHLFSESGPVLYEKIEKESSGGTSIVQLLGEGEDETGVGSKARIPSLSSSNMSANPTPSQSQAPSPRYILVFSPLLCRFAAL
jgi:hypothetical protein